MAVTLRPVVLSSKPVLDAVLLNSENQGRCGVGSKEKVERIMRRSVSISSC